MTLSRRQFLARTGLATAGLMTPSWFANPFVRRAFAQTIGDRYFVVLFLDGGNDGLNTVTPVDNGTIGGLRAAYEAARFAGSLQLSPTDLGSTTLGVEATTSTPIALHPGLIGLKHLYDQGHVAVIQGCGYPEANLSHDTSARKWATGQPTGALPATGWVGRYLANNYNSLQIPAVTADRTIATELQQTTTSVLGIDDLEDFGFPYDDYDSGDNAAKDAAFSALYASAKDSAQSTFRRVGSVGSAALTAAQVYPQAFLDYASDRASWNTQYETNRTSTKLALRDIAACIYGCANGMLENRVFQLSNGGYDTHGDQGTTADTDQHYRLHREIGDGLELFFADLGNMGLANKVTVMVWSEFSRRILQNDSGGTDHGTQGPMFVIGGAVNGGLYGSHPDINEASLNDDGNTIYSQAAGNPHRSTDFRDVYGTILKHWLGVADPSTLLPLDPTGSDPDLYWRSANFDMGFL